MRQRALLTRALVALAVGDVGQHKLSWVLVRPRRNLRKTGGDLGKRRQAGLGPGLEAGHGAVWNEECRRDAAHLVVYNNVAMVHDELAIDDLWPKVKAAGAAVKLEERCAKRCGAAGCEWPCSDPMLEMKVRARRSDVTERGGFSRAKVGEW